jgi:ribose 5-phosphate isomerase A
MHEGSFFLSENGNLLLDITFPTPLSHPEKVHEELLHIPGVIDTGFFFHIADQILVAYANGKVSLYTERIPQY